MLAVASALDSTQSQLVKGLDCQFTVDEMVIFVGGYGDISLEIDAAKESLRPLARALGKKVSLAPYSSALTEL